MDCRSALELIDIELDGELAPKDATALSEHLRSCAECARERELLLAVDRALAAAPLERAPAGFEQAVRSEIARRAEVRARIDSVVLPVAGGLAAVATGYGVHRLVNWSGARSLLQDVGHSLTRLASPLTDRVGQAPDLVSSLSHEQGVLGVTAALAIAAVVVIVMTGIAVLRHHDGVFGGHERPRHQHQGW
jgi:anti-sigma factor RsiW